MRGWEEEKGYDISSCGCLIINKKNGLLLDTSIFCIFRLIAPLFLLSCSILHCCYRSCFYRLLLPTIVPTSGSDLLQPASLTPAAHHASQPPTAQHFSDGNYLLPYKISNPDARTNSGGMWQETWNVSAEMEEETTESPMQGAMMEEGKEIL